MRHLSCSPTVELLGIYVIVAFVDNLQSEETIPIMEKVGLVGLQPEKWYPCHLWMDALNEMAAYPNVSSNLVAIGMRIGMMVPVPPTMTDPTLEKMLMNWDSAYQEVHRGGDVGSICCEKVGDGHFKTIHTDLYPDDFTYGIIYSYAQRFLPPGTDFKVFYDPEIPARDYGGKDKTVVHVQW